jgi:hypothetical protein
MIKRIKEQVLALFDLCQNGKYLLSSNICLFFKNSYAKNLEEEIRTTSLFDAMLLSYRMQCPTCSNIWYQSLWLQGSSALSKYVIRLGSRLVGLVLVLRCWCQKNRALLVAVVAPITKM